MEDEKLVAEPERRMECPGCRSLMHWCSSKRRVKNSGVVSQGCFRKADASHPAADCFICMWCGVTVADNG